MILLRMMLNAHAVEPAIKWQQTVWKLIVREPSLQRRLWRGIPKLEQETGEP